MGRWLLGGVILTSLLVTLVPAAHGQRTRVLLVATDTDLTGIDISDAASFNTGVILGLNVFDRLFEYGPRGLVPRLATSWETSADGTRWTFRLRRGVQFHDGTPFNAEAVKVNIERLLANRRLRQSRKFDGVVRVEVVDDLTVRLVTSEPLASLVGQLVHPAAGAFQSPAALRANRFAVGTGPFTLKQWVPDERIVFGANRDYWEGAPAVDEVIIRLVPEFGTRASLLESGQTHIAMALAPRDYARLRTNPRFVMATPPSGAWRFIGLNNQKRPFADVRVRQALNYAVDKQAILDKILLGVGRVLDSPYGSAMWGYKKTMVYVHDPQRARRLLAEAGVGGGFRTRLLAAPADLPGNLEIAQAVQQYLAAVGVTMEIETVEPAVLLREAFKPLEQNRTEMFQYWYGGADPDVLRLLLHSKEWSPGRNHSFYRNPAVDQLFIEGARTPDPGRRRKIYEQIQEIVMKDAPWIFLTEERRIDAWRSLVTGITHLVQDAGILDFRKVRFQ